jgi:hypothetical protein
VNAGAAGDLHRRNIHRAASVDRTRSRMPFTFLAHQAPVLPLVLLRPRWFDGIALCIGSMAPDLAYLASGTRCAFASHTGPALLWFCLPVTLVLTALVRRCAGPLLAHLPLPAGTRGRLSPLTTPAPAWTITLVSAGIGAITHILLDACTHRRGLGVALWPALKSVALHLGDRPIPIYALLQGPGSLLLALLAALCLRALARRGAPMPLPRPTPASRRRFVRVVAFGLSLAVIVPLLALPMGGLPALIIRTATLLFAALVTASLAAQRLAR